MNTTLNPFDMEALLQSASWVHVGKDHWRDPLNDVVYPLDEAFDVQKEREAAHTRRMKRFNSTAGLWFAFFLLAVFSGLAGFIIGRMYPAREVAINLTPSGWTVKQVPNSPQYILDIEARTLDAVPLEVKVYSQEAWTPNDKALAERIVMRAVAEKSLGYIRMEKQKFTEQIVTDVGGYSGNKPVYGEKK